MATIQTIIDNARTDIRIDPGKVIITDASLVRYANEAVNLLYAKADYKFKFKDGTVALLVAGQANYTPATDYGKLLWAKLVDGDADSTQVDESVLINVTDDLVNWQQERDMDYQADAPAYIYEEDSVFKVWPIPNAAAVARYTIKYKYSEISDVLTTASTPSFPIRWHFILEHYIKYRAFAGMPGAQNQALAQSALSEWNAWLPKVTHDMLVRQDEAMSYGMVKLPSKRNK